MIDQCVGKVMLIEKPGTEPCRMLRASQGKTLPGSSRELRNSQAHSSSSAAGLNLSIFFSKHAMRSTCI